MDLAGSVSILGVNVSASSGCFVSWFLFFGRFFFFLMSFVGVSDSLWRRADTRSLLLTVL